MSPEAEPSQDVLTTVRKRLELAIDEIEDAEVIAMLRTAMSELDAALAQSDAERIRKLEAECGRFENELFEARTALAQSDAEPVAWQPDANMRAELDRSELVARTLLKELMKQIDFIEAEGNIEWHKRIKLSGELYLPDLAASVLAVLYAAPPRPDASAGLIEAAEIAEKEANNWGTGGITLREFAVKLRAVAAVRNNPEAFAKLKAIRARAADRGGK